MILPWLNKACKIYTDFPTGENKNRIFEIINLNDVLTDKKSNSAKLKRAYFFLMSVPQTDPVKSMIENINQRLENVEK